MGTQVYNYTPDLSVEAARYSPHDYLVRFTAQTFGWTLSVARRIEDGRPVYTTPEERETCIMITHEQALDLVDTWNFILQAEAEEAADEALRLEAEVDFGMEFPKS